MDISRGGGVVIAAGPTDLKRYLPISLLVTGIVVGIPVWIVFGLTNKIGWIATFLSIASSVALSNLGARAWKRWPGSRDVVFNDLMLWGYARRTVTQKRLIRRVERLGFSTNGDSDALSLEDRTELLKKLAVALEVGDPYTHGHSQRVARHAYMIAKTMKLPRRQAEKIRLAGVIHDVGKLRIPREIITKPGKLTDAEFDVIKRHTVDGAKMVEVLRDPEITDMVRHHHERLDGSGYPDRLIAEEISIGARVLAVADTFDAASSLRPYRPAQKHQVALDILQKEADAGRLDADVVEAFVRYYSGGRAIRWWAFLSTGSGHLADLPISFAQRLGAAGLANAALVGVTAVALAPGSPLHGLGIGGAELARSDRPAQIATEVRSEEAGAESHGAETVARQGNGNNGRSEANKGRGRKERSRGKGDGRPNGAGSGSGNSGKSEDAPGKNREDNEHGKNGENGNAPSTDETATDSTDVVDETVDNATGTAGGATNGATNGGGQGSATPPKGPDEAVDDVTDPVTEEPASAPPGNSDGKGNGK